MSADNYYVVQPHPSGVGFSYVMGFASDEGPLPKPSHQHPVHLTIEAAYKAAGDLYAEYGPYISEEAWERANQTEQATAGAELSRD